MNSKYNSQKTVNTLPPQQQLLLSLFLQVFPTEVLLPDLSNTLLLIRIQSFQTLNAIFLNV